jgi:acetyltransferase-like isoleucine patch superfamily enzyme
VSSGYSRGPAASAQLLREIIPEPLTRWVQGLHFLCTRLVGHIPSHSLRLVIYRRVFGLNVAPSAHVYGRLELRKAAKVKIGENTIVGHDNILDGRGGIVLGRNVNLSSQVAIWTMQHDPQSPEFGVRVGAVVVEDRAWVSFRATVLPGVTIGEGAVVAAGAVVTTDVEPHQIVGGIPARPIGRRTDDLRYELGPGQPFI